MTSSLEAADCVITHSGGVLELPARLPDKLVLVVVPSTGYNGTLADTMLRKVILDISHAWRQKQMAFWFRKTAINLFYALNLPRTAKLFIANRRLGRGLPACQAAKVAIIVQPRDPWSRDLPEKTITAHADYTYITIPGHHDDIWQYPDAYIKLLTKIGEQQ